MKNLYPKSLLGLLLLFLVSTHINAQCPTLDAGPDLTIDCTSPGVELQILIDGMPELVLPNRDTSSYRIGQPTCPMPALTGTPTGLNVDDTYSGVIPIGFNFDYFGNTYTDMVVGANGKVSFDTGLAGGFDNWNIDPTDLLPFEDGSSFEFNMIYGAYHDIHPGIGGAIEYFVAGVAPERALVVNYNAVPHFSCTTIFTTQQIVLYESTNVIQVNIVDKPVCSGWNDGLAVLGIQGNDLTEFAVPPGRNTGAWAASDETWFFLPDGAQDPNTTFEVINQTTGLVEATTLPAFVNPGVTTT
ncbi:MAG: hypothetical protein HKN48_08980, partial [Flavobacteriaceae bacterium]|nr:hypothetical protein [Flavobacteriaceae bacterium]